MTAAIAALYKTGVITRETVEPYSAGNPTQYTRTRYGAVVVEPEAEQ